MDRGAVGARNSLGDWGNVIIVLEGPRRRRESPANSARLDRASPPGATTGTMLAGKITATVSSHATWNGIVVEESCYNYPYHSLPG